MMRAFQIGGFLAVTVFTSACGVRSEPEKALYAYAEAVRSRRCGEAMGFLSERTRYALDFLRVKPQHPQSQIPLEEYYCSKFAFEDCKLSDMNLTSAEANSATVSMPCGRTQDGILPGFPSMFLKYEPRETGLVKEDNDWRVVLPHVIRIVEIREREDKIRDEALREQERRRVPKIN
jgi:hypothetical protein